MDRRYIYDQWNLIMDIDGLPVAIGWTKRCYTWGLDLSGQNGASAVGTSPSPLGLHGAGGTLDNPNARRDRQGQVVDWLNGGAIAAHYEYGPYGNWLMTGGSYCASNPFRFSTKYFDAKTPSDPFADGLYYYGYRYYDPRLGRWMSRDPLGERGGANLYAFVRNCPCGRWDFLGLKDNPVLITLPDGEKMEVNCAEPDPPKPGEKPRPCQQGDIKPSAGACKDACEKALNGARSKREVKELLDRIAKHPNCLGVQPPITCGRCTGGCKGAGAWHFGTGAIVICDDQTFDGNKMMSYMLHELTHELQKCTKAPDANCEDRLRREMEAY